MRTLNERLLEYSKAQYWSGFDCVPLGMPWFVPGATNLLLTTELREFFGRARVLELGCGGSTLFFSELAKEVVSIETDEKWLARMQPLKPANVTFKFVAPGNDDVALAQLMSILDREADFDVVLIDNNPEHMVRRYAASLVLHHLKPKAICITDNYFQPQSLVAEFTIPSDWDHRDFNDRRWHGCGTRVSLRGF